MAPLRAPALPALHASLDVSAHITFPAQHRPHSSHSPSIPRLDLQLPQGTAHPHGLTFSLRTQESPRCAAEAGRLTECAPRVRRQGGTTGHSRKESRAGALGAGLGAGANGLLNGAGAPGVYRRGGGEARKGVSQGKSHPLGPSSHSRGSLHVRGAMGGAVGGPGGAVPGGAGAGFEAPPKVDSVVNSLQTMPPRASVSKCMEVFKGKVSLQEFALVFKELAKRGEWHLAWRLFKYMQRQSWCSPNEHIYTIMIGIMGREKMLDKCLELFEGMPENGVEWNVYSFTALINAYGRNGRYEVSLDLLARMRREGVAPNLITYNSVLNACSKGALPWDQLLRVFALMREDGVQPDRITFSTLLAACATRGLVVEAGSVFRTMVRSGVAPDPLAYATVIDIFRRGGRLGIVRMLLQEMANNEGGPKPEEVAYTMLIDAYGMEGDHHAAVELFDELTSSGLTPDISTFTALLKALGRCGRYEDARQMVRRMKDFGATPDLDTYHALIQVFTAGGYFREAASMFQDMQAGGVELTEETYMLLMLACGEGGLSADAGEIYRHMRERSFLPNWRTLQGLISAHGNSARYSEALSALHDAINLGVTAERGPFHALMEAYAKAGLPDDAAFVYALMLQEGGDGPRDEEGEGEGEEGAGGGASGTGATPEIPWRAGKGVYGNLGPPATRTVLYATNETFNLLIEAFCKAGLYDEALSIRDDMLEARRSPDEFTYEAMVSVYCGVGHYEAALAQVLEIKEEGIVPPLTCYCDLLTLCARRGRWRSVRMILEEMGGIRRGEGYNVVRQIVLGAYSTEEAWPVAEEFLSSLKAQGVAANFSFYCSLLDALWALGLRQTAARVLRCGVRRGIFPELLHQSSTLWALNVHRLSPGAAVTALYVGMSELREEAQRGAEELPPIFSIVLRHGTDGDSTEGEMLPLKRALQDSLRALQTPFQAPDWNRTGRYVCRRDTLLQWLENDESQRVLHLSNAELPAEVLSRKR